ncbi:MAG: hypothetical protein R3345_13880, partial [Fulvivirga sp.]|nr:hypothetical protein [Fulvivirga sp.]
IKAYLSLEGLDEAIFALREGAENGATGYTMLKQHPDYQALREHPEFPPLLEQIEHNTYPCLTDSNNRHFDFWLGEWEVYVNGKKVGDNSITLANGGCAIHESYTTGMRDFTGQSINYYDKKDGKWHQVWVGSGGGVLDYVEIDKAEGMLQFQCDYLSQKGEVVYSRLTFTANEDGTVRQFFENSRDGVEWTPGFDGLYKKKSE